MFLFLISSVIGFAHSSAKDDLNYIENYYDTTDVFNMHYGKLKLSFNVKSEMNENIDSNYFRTALLEYKDSIDHKLNCPDVKTKENSIILVNKTHLDYWINNTGTFKVYREKDLWGMIATYDNKSRNTIFICGDCGNDIKVTFIHELTHLLGNYCENIDNSEMTAKFYEKNYVEHLTHDMVVKNNNF